MNSVNFENKYQQFPLSTESLIFIQDIIQQSHKLALIGGVDKYILSGCTNTNGNNWSEGILSINGELLPFKGGNGTLTSTVRIKDVKRDVIAGYDTYESVYTERYVEFGTNIGNVNTYVWNTFTKLKSNLELEAQSATKEELEVVRSLVMPKGGIIMWSGSIAEIPIGFALCNGSTVNGLVTPNLSGRFIVGLDESITTSTVPTNVADLTENYGIVGSRGGKPNVLLEAANIPKLTIKGRGGADDKNFSNQDSLSGSDKPANEGWDFDYNIGNENPNRIENRPPYYVLAYIIKVV